MLKVTTRGVYIVVIAVTISIGIFRQKKIGEFLRSPILFIRVIFGRIFAVVSYNPFHNSL